MGPLQACGIQSNFNHLISNPYSHLLADPDKWNQETMMMMTATHHSNYIFTVQNYHTLNIIIKKEKQHARYSSSLIHEPGLRNFLQISQ